MKIEVLYVPNCPNHAVVLERLREILVGERLEAQLNEVLVSSAAMAHSLKFPGSPTIRINGHDIAPPEGERLTFGLMCRLYADGDGAPSRQILRDAIQRARGLEV
jgi:hypothetical protein